MFMGITKMKPALPLLGLLLVAGCGGAPDVARMKAGLVKSGMAENQSECVARELSKTAKAAPYNYLAGLLEAGVEEKNAVNKARRKYGPEFKTAVDEAVKRCSQ